MTAFYDNKPLPFEAVGNGSYFFRYDIEEFTTEEESPRSQWKCKEVTVWGNLTREKVMQAVIESKWSPSMESKILNDYIAATNSFFSEDENEEYIAVYNDFLVARNNIKEIVNIAWEAFNVTKE